MALGLKKGFDKMQSGVKCADYDPVWKVGRCRLNEFHSLAIVLCLAHSFLDVLFLDLHFSGLLLTKVVGVAIQLRFQCARGVVNHMQVKFQ